MFDVIGRRRWFYLFSALLTIPGLIFILLTFVSNGQAGLRFSIDYTGGTVWQVRFADANVTPAQVKQVLVENGLPDSTVDSTQDGSIRIRTVPIGLPRSQ